MVFNLEHIVASHSKAAKENLTVKQATDTIKLVLNGFTDTLKKEG